MAQAPQKQPMTMWKTELSNDAVVFGDDYGTLRGRFVVVRIGDEHKLDTGVPEYAYAVLDQARSGGEPLPRRPELAQSSPLVDDSASQSRRVGIQSPLSRCGAGGST